MFKTFKKTYTLPFKYNIPNYTKKYLETTSIIKRFSKFFRRYLYISLYSQRSLEQNEIKDTQKRILWINLSAPSLGDSLMDLSSRVLLKDKTIDLFTDIKNAHIYQHDKIFKKVITNSEDIVQKDYDLVIIDSFGTKSLKTKFNFLPSLPYVGMYGYYNGPEVNRVLFSFHRLNQLLGYSKSEDDVNSIAKSVMYISDEDIDFVSTLQLPKDYITIAIGGEWGYRTYNNWDKVIEYIQKNYPNENIVLVGSNNAIEEEAKLLDDFSNLISAVGKYSFNKTAQIIKNSNLLICCDGGLMHSANSVNTPVLALFARLTIDMQLTKIIKHYSLFDEDDVNNISSSDIIKKFEDYKKEN
jgi:heptosyltransferase-2